MFTNNLTRGVISIYRSIDNDHQMSLLLTSRQILQASYMGNVGQSELLFIAVCILLVSSLSKVSIVYRAVHIVEVLVRPGEVQLLSLPP